MKGDYGNETDLTRDDLERLERRRRVDAAQPAMILTFQDALRAAALANHNRPGSLGYVTDHLLQAADEIDKRDADLAAGYRRIPTSGPEWEKAVDRALNAWFGDDPAYWLAEKEGGDPHGMGRAMAAALRAALNLETDNGR